MLPRPDYAALIAGQTLVIEMINSGEAGLPVLNQLLGLAQGALGAAGMSFAEYGPSGGRVIAATGAVQWALGRPVDLDNPAVAALLAGLRTKDVQADLLPQEVADQLRGRGLGRLLIARAEVGGLVVGSLHAHFPPTSDQDHPEQHAVMAYLASFVAHLYIDQAGLPVHGDEPAAAARADGLAIVDQHGLVRLWNQAAERVTGHQAADLLGQPLPFRAPPSGKVLQERLPDGRWLRIASGELPGTMGSRVITFRDITDRHRHDDDRDLFVAVTSHELRTPVTVIKGYADTLHNHWESLTEADRRQAARVIRQRADDLARLVERLLSTANELSSVAGSPCVPFDLVAALRSAVADLPANLRQRLTVELPADLPKALGDRASVATVLTELVTNAQKYSDAGTPVKLAAAADELTVMFRVTDHGIGIRPEHVERAFDRFWQGEANELRRYPGVGLGLYLVRKIVERQKGWISLRPGQKGGTVAEVRLPRG
ncbi:MAG TPA: PAS domain-containing sensor histidine kinase [Micromonosporaceae bacterium]|nr:PAS domain-containing sensor histidine kinase [Micromonosporaceae bacterium]